MKFSTRVLCLVLIAAILPLTISVTVSVISSLQTLNGMNEQRLVALRDVKKSQLETLFVRFKDNLYAVAEIVEQRHSNLFSPSTHQVLTELNKRLHFYDVFVISPAGDIVYSAAREADYQTNLITGDYSQSNLGALFRQLQNSSELFAAADFAPYAPSNNEPAAFIGVPLTIDGERWVVATQLSIEQINLLMQTRSGMGDTGETYLIGPDYLMRSDSFLDPTHHSINASFAGTVSQNGVKTKAALAALSGKTAVNIVDDYNGNSVLSAYAPVMMYDKQWAILAEIDEVEVTAPASQLIWVSSFVFLLALAFAGATGWFVVRSVMRPLGGEPDEMHALMHQVAQGDLAWHDKDAPANSLKASLQALVAHLRSMMENMSATASQLSSTADALSVVTEKTESTMESQSDELNSIVTAVNEMTASISDVSNSAVNVAGVVSSAHKIGQAGLTGIQEVIGLTEQLTQQVEEGHGSIQVLAHEVADIRKLVDVIRGVAEQTNLLALNAAIEAARAGESGRGFAVVADEVRQLAVRSEQSTHMIEDVITTIGSQSEKTVQNINTSLSSVTSTQQSIHAVGTHIEEIAKAIDAVNSQVLSVSSATEQQAAVANSVDQSLHHVRDTGQQTLKGAHDITVSSQHVAQVAEQLKGMLDKFRV